MGFSLGDFAGGVASGAASGARIKSTLDENARKQTEADARKVQLDRQAKLQALEDGAQAANAAAYTQARTGEAPPPPAGPGLSSIASQQQSPQAANNGAPAGAAVPVSTGAPSVVQQPGLQASGATTAPVTDGGGLPPPDGANPSPATPGQLPPVPTPADAANATPTTAAAAAATARQNGVGSGNKTLDQDGNVLTSMPNGTTLTNNVATNQNGDAVNPKTPSINANSVGLADTDRPKTPLERLVASSAPGDKSNPSRIPHVGTHEEAMMQGMKARMDYYAKNGLNEQAIKTKAQMDDMRVKVRQMQLDSADIDYKKTGDPLVYAKKLMPYIADGNDYVDGRTYKDNGVDFVEVKTYNNDTGKNETHTYTKDQYLDQVKFAANPANARAMEAEHAKLVFSTNEKIREKNAEIAGNKGKDLAVEGVKAEAASKLEDKKAAAGLAQARVSAGGTIGAARISADGAKEREQMKIDSDSGVNGITNKADRVTAQTLGDKRKNIQSQLSDISRREDIRTKNANPDDSAAAGVKFDEERRPLQEEARSLTKQLDEIVARNAAKATADAGGPGLPRKAASVAEAMQLKGLKAGQTVTINGDTYDVKPKAKK